MGPEEFTKQQYLQDDQGVLHRVEWRIPQLGERYFRQGQEHVAVLRQPCKSERWVLIDQQQSAGRQGSRFKVVDKTLKVNLAHREWL